MVEEIVQVLDVILMGVVIAVIARVGLRCQLMLPVIFAGGFSILLVG